MGIAMLFYVLMGGNGRRFRRQQQPGSAVGVCEGPLLPSQLILNEPVP